MKRLLSLLMGFALVLGLSVTGSPAHAISGNLLTNGGFESGNTGFTSDYTYVVAPGPTALWVEGTYTVGYDAHDYHYLWSNVTPRSGNLMLIANGATQPNMNVWSSTVTGLVPGDVYVLSAWVTSVYPASPAELTFSFTNTTGTSTIGGGITASSPGDWTEFTGMVVAPDGVTSGTFSIGNSNTIAAGSSRCTPCGR